MTDNPIDCPFCREKEAEITRLKNELNDLRLPKPSAERLEEVADAIKTVAYEATLPSQRKGAALYVLSVAFNGFEYKDEPRC